MNYLKYRLEDDKYCGVPAKNLRTYCHPDFFKAMEDVFYRNNGDGTFSDATRTAGFFKAGGKGLGVVVGDYDNDGWPDVFVTNDSTRNFLYRNKSKGTFEEVGVMAGVAYNEAGDDEAGMGTDFGDFNGDGLLDLYSTHLDDETNTLYVNTGDGFFEDQTYARGLGSPTIRSVGFGTQFFDFDNDGDLDIFVTNGHINDIIEHIKEGFFFRQTDQLFENVGGQFQDISSSAGPHFQRKTLGRGAAFGDYDNDGDIDIVISNNNGPAIVLRNERGNQKGWIGLALRGKKSNRDALGARIQVRAGGRRQFREVRMASSYLSQSDVRVHFGLGRTERLDSLEVQWPSGLNQVFQNIPANQYLSLQEGGELRDRNGKAVGKKEGA